MGKLLLHIYRFTLNISLVIILWLDNRWQLVVTAILDLIIFANVLPVDIVVKP